MKDCIYKVMPARKKIDKMILEYVVDKGKVTNRDVSKKFNISTSLAGKHLNILSRKGILSIETLCNHEKYSVYSFNGNANNLNSCRICGAYTDHMDKDFGLLCNDCLDNFMDATKSISSCKITPKILSEEYQKIKTPSSSSSSSSESDSESDNIYPHSNSHIRRLSEENSEAVEVV